MNVNDAFPSKYLKASDLPEHGTQSATIETVAIEEIGKQKDRKPVIHFSDLDKGLVCNKTNAKTIAKVLGTEEFDDWSGKTIHLARAEVEFCGEMVESIRVRLRAGKSNGTTDDDEIPS